MPATLMRARVGRVRQARGRGPARSRAPARGAYRLEGRGQVQLHLRRPRERHEAHLRLGPHAEAQARVELDLAHLDDDARARGARVLARGHQRVRGVHARLREVAPELGAAHPEEHGDVEVVAVEGVARVDDEVAGRQVAVVEALGDGHRVHLRRRVAQLEVDQLEVPDEAVGGGRAVRGVQVRLERLVEERGHLRVQDRDDDVAPQLVQQAGAAADATATEVYRGRVRSPRDTNRRARRGARAAPRAWSESGRAHLLSHSAVSPLDATITEKCLFICRCARERGRPLSLAAGAGVGRSRRVRRTWPVRRDARSSRCSS